jgi:hypothetical protein
MGVRTVDFGSVLARLARSTVMEDGDLSGVLRAITEAAAALQVERVNIWMFDRARTRIRCIQAYERGANRHTQGDEILASVAPSYFAALAELRTVAAFDALNDPRTRELAGYLQPRGITTLLDAPSIKAESLPASCATNTSGRRDSGAPMSKRSRARWGTSSPWP